MQANLYESKKQRLIKALQSRKNGTVRLHKDTSNLFRDRDDNGAKSSPDKKIDVRDFGNVIEVNSAQGWVEVEGMTTYAALVDATLRHGLMPCVVPQLKSITIGGAVSGIGIESSSFRYGLPHETVLEMEVLTGDGAVVVCTPNNNHRDLFFGIPNSYGTLGYILKLKARTIAVKPFVQLRHIRHRNAEDFFREIEHQRAHADFIDGSIFAADALYLTVGRFVDAAPFTSDYTYKHIYYRSIRERETDYLTIHDYIWRWDTDWFWCSKNLYVQNPLIRRLVGKKRLNSVNYTKIMRWNSRWGITDKINRLLGVHTESVIQDVDIPIQHGAEFLDFFLREIGITPIWVCPFKMLSAKQRFPLFATDPDTLYVNFGFWDVVSAREKHPAGYFNRKVERKVQELGGIKSLYSDAFFEPEEFWSIYSKPVFDALKARYDPGGAFKDLYQKTVLKK